MKKLFILFAFLLLLPLSKTFGQVISTEGKEFYAGFMQIQTASGANTLRFVISSRLGASGTISMPTRPSFTPISFVVPPNGTFTTVPPASLNISPSLAAVGSSNVEDKGFYIKSDNNDISVTAINHLQVRTEASAVLPITSLGASTEYIINTNQTTGSNISEFIIVGVVDNSVIEITPSVALSSGQAAGVRFNVTLQRGKIVQYQNVINQSTDLTGTRIKSSGTCKPFAVFAGTHGATFSCPISGLPATQVSAQHTFEQQYPIQTWGKEYIVTPYAELNGYWYRIVAKDDNTTITIIDGGVPTVLPTLNSGQNVLRASPSANSVLCINADKPISIVQISPNSGCDSGKGDPSLLVLNPLNQTTNQTTFNTTDLSVTGPFGHYVNVIMKTTDIANLRFNGSANLPATNPTNPNAPLTGFFTTIASCNTYSYAQIPISNINTATPVTTTLASTSEFVAFAYGFSSVDIYAYSVGASFENQQYNFIANPSPACFDGTPASRTVNFVGTGINVTSYSYDFGDGSPVAVGQNQVHTYALPGNYTVKMTVTVVGGCGTDFVEKTIKIYDTTIPANIGADRIVCQNTALTLTAPAGTDQTYKWFEDGVLIVGATLQTYLVPTATANTVKKYKVEILKGNTCLVTSNEVQVTVAPPPTVSLTPAMATFCAGGNLLLTVEPNPLWNYEFFRNNITITGQGGNGINTITVNLAGNYTCKVTSEFGCITTTNIAVISIPPTIVPVVTSVNGKTFFCNGGSLDLQTSITPTDVYTYQWQREIATVFTNIPTATLATFTATLAGKYRVIATSTTNTCNGISAEFIVDDKPNPIAVITPNALVFCAEETVNLSATAAPTGETYNYEWKKDGVVAGTTQVLNFPAIAGTFVYKVKITNATTLCETTSADITIIINPIPDPTITANPLVICQGESTTINAIPQPAGQVWVYEWSRNGVVIPMQTTNNLVVTSSGNYKVKITTDKNCVRETPLALTITVNPMPIATISATLTTLCSAFTTTISTLAVPAGEIWTYIWTRNGVPIAGETNATLVTNIAGAYIVTITNQFNCSATTAVPLDIIVNPSPDATITTTANVICQGQFATLNALIAPTGQVWSYEWSRNGSVIPTATNNNLIVTSSGNYKVKITTDKNCVMETPLAITITVNPIPLATISATLTTLCSDFTSTISTAAVPAGHTWTYIWKRNGTAIAGETNATLVTNISGDYTVTITNQFNCSVTTVIPLVITVNPSPVATITAAPTTICQGQFTTITALTQPAGQVWNYEWSRNGIVISGQTNNTLIATLAGAYKVKITTDKNCIKETAIPITITVNPLPVVAINGIATSYCSNDVAIDLTGKGTPAGGTFTLVKNAGAPTTVTQIDIPTLGAGTYVLTYSFTNATTNCTNTAVLNFLINNVLPVAITNLNDKYCINDAPVVLTGSGVGGTGQFFINGVASTSLNPTNLGALGLTHLVRYVYTYGTGCEVSAEKTVTVNQLPTVSITGLAPQYCSNGIAANLIATVSPAGGTGFFRINGSLVTAVPPKFNPVTLGTGNHLVEYFYTDLNGCENQTSQNVEVLAPTALSFNALAAKYCQNVADITLSASPAGGKFYVNGILETKFRPATLGIGVHSVKYEFTQTGTASCVDNITQAVTVVAPTKVFYTNPIRKDYCVDDADVLLIPLPVGATVTIDGFPAPAGAAPNTYIFSPSAWGSRATPYIVETTFVDVNLCTDVLTSQVFVNPLPIVSMTGVNPAYCLNDAVFTPIVSPVGGTFTLNGTAITPPIKPATIGEGTFNLVYTYKDAKACQSTAQVTFVIKPLPASRITTTFKAIYCSTEAAFFLNATPIGGSFFINSAPVTGLPNTGLNTVSFNPSTVGVNPKVQIVYSFTAANGCTKNDTSYLEIIAPPIAPILQNYVICKSVGSQRLNAYVASHTSNISYIWTNKVTGLVLATTPSLIVTETGIYRVQITDSRACNPVFAESKVDINPNPKVNLGANRSICGNVEFTLDADPNGENVGSFKYLWSTGATTQKITLKSDTIRGTRSYSVTVTDENFPSKCSSKATVLLFFNDIAVVNLGKDRSICNPKDVPYTLIGQDISHANLGVTYKWTNPFATNPSAVLATTPNYAITQPGVYALTVTTNKDCSNSDTVQILFDSNPSMKILGADNGAGVCQLRDTLYLQATNVLNYDILWSGPGIVSTSADKLTVIVEKSGRYFVKATDKTKTTKCDAVLFVDVFIADFPAVVIKPLSATKRILACQDSTVLLNAGDTSHRGNFKYEWRVVGNTAIISSSSQFALTQTIAGSFDPIKYTVRVSPPSGCITNDTVTVQFQPKPIAKIDDNYPRQICFGESFTLRASGGTDFKWTSTDKSVATIPNNASVVFKPKAAGTYTYTVEVSTPTSTVCKSTKISVTVIVNPPMLAKVSNKDAKVCETETIELDGFDPIHPLSVRYSWKSLVTGTIIGTGTKQKFNFQALLPRPSYNPENYEFSVTDGITGCVAKDTFKITFLRKAKPIIDNRIKQICIGDSLILTASQGGTYRWSNGDTTATIRMKPKFTGLQTYWVASRFSPLCEEGTDTIRILVNPLPIAVANEFKNLKVCAGDKVVLKASGGVRYVWRHGDNSAETTIFPIKDSTYVVDVYNEGGCKATDSVRVKVTPIKLLPPRIVLCENERTTLDATNPDKTAVATYLWDNGDQRPIVPIFKAGIYTVTVKILDCVYKQTTEVIYRSRPRIALSNDTLLCFARANEIAAPPYRPITHTLQAKLNNRESGETYYYDWRIKGSAATNYISGAVGIVAADNFVPLTLNIAGADTSYIVRIRVASTNCETYDTIRVNMNCDARIKVPSGFTPNDDKLNDTFAPITSDLTGILIQVYHKWGDVVYEKFIDPKKNKNKEIWDGVFDEKEGWDGTFGGSPVPMDSYQYVIVIWSKDRKGFAVRRSMTGNIQVVREFTR